MSPVLLPTAVCKDLRVVCFKMSRGTEGPGIPKTRAASGFEASSSRFVPESPAIAARLVAEFPPEAGRNVLVLVARVLGLGLRREPDADP